MTGRPLASGGPVLCLITDLQLVGHRSLEFLIADAVEGGINLVQIREKALPTRELLDVTLRVRDAVAGRAPVVINGRSDVAVATGLDGVHLPSDGIPAESARHILGADAIIGQSVHSPEEVRLADSPSIDYVEFGTIFPSRSHPDGAILGIEPLREAAHFGIPVIGVGGITPANVASVIEAGALGVAVISAILADADPRRATERLATAAGEAWGRSRSRVAAGVLTPTQTLPRREGGNQNSA